MAHEAANALKPAKRALPQFCKAILFHRVKTENATMRSGEITYGSPTEVRFLTFGVLANGVFEWSVPVGAI